MFERNLWKILLSLVLVGWAVWTLYPLKDQNFADYARSHAGAKTADFNKLVDEAAGRVKAGTASSEFVGLKQIGRERGIDLTEYFPDIKLEAKLKSKEKRNNILLTELLARSKSKLQLGLDLKGGISVTLEVDPVAAAKQADAATKEALANTASLTETERKEKLARLAKLSEDERKEKLSNAIDIITKRINSFGIGEPIIRAIGDNRIEIQLPGVNTKDNPDVVDNIKKPARLDFRTVHPTLSPSDVPPGEVPPGYEVMTLDFEGQRGDSVSEEIFVKRIPEMGGAYVAESRAMPDMYGKPEVSLRFTKEGAARFAEVTKELADSGRANGRLGRLAIVLDGKLYSAPTVREEISGGNASISGGAMTDRDAILLAQVLNNPLDLPLIVKEQKEVGPQLAEDAISSGLKAAVIGTALVVAFMVTFYTSGGLVAVITLAVNLVIIFGSLAALGATLTLPGLAGIVLTVGMAVDANILIFERMREERAAGKSLVASNQSGFLKALTTILDAHFVQLIICGIMIWLGTGPIRGFGFTLLIGVISTLISVLITAHMLMEILIESAVIKKFTMNRMLKGLNVDFIKYGKPAAIGSVLLVVVGLAVVAYKGNRIYGIDFAGGDQITLQFDQRIDTANIRHVADAAKIGEVQPTYTSALGGGKEVLEIETAVDKSGAMLAALKSAYPQAGFVKVGENHIGASIGKEIELNALLAVGVSMLTILAYIAFRFEFGFGIGAMFSTLHDILMTIGVFVLFGNQFSAPMVAAILCIAGYSINETVVVFDRIREELKLNPTGTLREVINSAINKVFARTIMTATTTFLAALSLFLFGGGVLHSISFTFLVGIVTSTFSAIFIAAQVFYWWHKGDRKHVEAHADVAPKYEWTGSSKASQ